MCARLWQLCARLHSAHPPQVRMTARFWGVPVSRVVYHKLMQATNELQIHRSQLDCPIIHEIIWLMDTLYTIIT